MNRTESLVSVIVTTRNNTATLEACLRSIVEQSYAHTELLVVDNNSTDDTKAIAKRFTDKVFNKGPERSVQRNFAVEKAKGDWVLIIDSDMELETDVVQSCVETATSNPELKALIIPEESFGEGYWAHCKALERSFYVGQDSIEAARFFGKALYQKVGGYNPNMTGGEDWDLTKRIRKVANVGRSKVYIRHNEGCLYFTRTIRKMFYYGKHAAIYFAENPTPSALTDQSGPLARYKLFFSKPGKLLRHPLLTIGMLTLKTAEFGVGGFGYVLGKRAFAASEAKRNTDAGKA